MVLVARASRGYGNIYVEALLNEGQERGLKLPVLWIRTRGNVITG